MILKGPSPIKNVHIIFLKISKFVSKTLQNQNADKTFAKKIFTNFTDALTFPIIRFAKLSLTFSFCFLWLKSCNLFLISSSLFCWNLNYKTLFFKDKNRSFIRGKMHEMLVKKKIRYSIFSKFWSFFSDFVEVNCWCMSEWAGPGTSKIFIVPTV